MSSTGPTVYAITDTDAQSISKDLASAFKERGLDCETIITEANNLGARIES
jgi:beta-ribofuranosylaminobenzene 5'-phosphate synthase